MASSPFLTYSEAMQARYGTKAYKLTLSGGRTCPTRDGTFGPKKGWGGCTFCDVHGSASFFANQRRALPVRMQLEAAAEAIRERFKAEKFIAYFQSYTTTHQEIVEYQQRYDEAVRFPGIVALAVGTRPDCLPDEVLDVLCQYLDDVDVQLELGVQSFLDPVLEWFDRGHDVACAIDALERALRRSRLEESRGRKGRLDVSAHLIFGAPMESDADIVTTALRLNKLGVHGVKLHHLHVLKMTKLERLHRSGALPLLEIDEYMEKAILFLRHLEPCIVVHRTHGLAPNPEELVGPAWSIQKIHPAEKLKQIMRKRSFRQGDLL